MYWKGPKSVVWAQDASPTMDPNRTQVGRIYTRPDIKAQPDQPLPCPNFGHDMLMRWSNLVKICKEGHLGALYWSKPKRTKTQTAAIAQWGWRGRMEIHLQIQHVVYIYIDQNDHHNVMGSVALFTHRSQCLPASFQEARASDLPGTAPWDAAEAPADSGHASSGLKILSTMYSRLQTFCTAAPTNQPPIDLNMYSDGKAKPLDDAQYKPKWVC